VQQHNRMYVLSTDNLIAWTAGQTSIGSPPSSYIKLRSKVMLSAKRLISCTALNPISKFMQAAFGASSSPAFGTPQSTPAFGAQTFGATPTSTFGGGGNAFGAASTPAFGGGFGAASTPAFGSAGFGTGDLAPPPFLIAIVSGLRTVKLGKVVGFVLQPSA